MRRGAGPNESRRLREKAPNRFQASKFAERTAIRWLGVLLL